MCVLHGVLWWLLLVDWDGLGAALMTLHCRNLCMYEYILGRSYRAQLSQLHFITHPRNPILSAFFTHFILLQHFTYIINNFTKRYIYRYVAEPEPPEMRFYSKRIYVVAFCLMFSLTI